VSAICKNNAIKAAVTAAITAAIEQMTYDDKGQMRAAQRALWLSLGLAN
jgi:hypothetical protein